MQLPNVVRGKRSSFPLQLGGGGRELARGFQILDGSPWILRPAGVRQLEDVQSCVCEIRQVGERRRVLRKERKALRFYDMSVFGPPVR